MMQQHPHKLRIHQAADLTLEILESLLQTHAPIHLKGFQLQPQSASHAQNFRVLLEDALPNTGWPSSLYLKICPLKGHFVANSEIHYYTRDYISLQAAPLLTCYAAGGDRHAYFLLLQDVSDTHSHNKDVPPSPVHAQAVGQALARLHAHYWGQTGSSAQWERYLESFLPHVPSVLALLSSNWPRGEVQALSDWLERGLAHLGARLAHPLGQTLLHGDPNPSNVLSPHDPSGITYLIDRQPFLWSLSHGLGVMDLAYMAVPYWQPEDRRACELPLLQSYHQTLRAAGINNYSWEQCLADYRLSLVMGLFAGLSWKGSPSMRWLWEAQLQRSLQAFRDWQDGPLPGS